MSRLEQLYQEMILDHNRNPRHFESLAHPTHTAFGKNPLCGDEYHLELGVKNGVITSIGFQGTGCAISKSSASLMSTVVLGKSIEEARAMKDAFLSLLTSEVLAPGSADLGKLKIFEGVKKYPARVKCAALIWRALEAALAGVCEISTE